MRYDIPGGWTYLESSDGGSYYLDGKWCARADVPGAVRRAASDAVRAQVQKEGNRARSIERGWHAYRGDETVAELKARQAALRDRDHDDALFTDYVVDCYLEGTNPRAFQVTRLSGLGALIVHQMDAGQFALHVVEKFGLKDVSPATTYLRVNQALLEAGHRLKARGSRVHRGRHSVGQCHVPDSMAEAL